MIGKALQMHLGSHEMRTPALTLLEFLQVLGKAPALNLGLELLVGPSDESKVLVFLYQSHCLAKRQTPYLGDSNQKSVRIFRSI